MNTDQPQTVVLSQEDYQWFLDLRQAVGSYLIALNTYRLHPEDEKNAKLQQAEEKLVQASRTLTTRRSVARIIEEVKAEMAAEMPSDAISEQE